MSFRSCEDIVLNKISEKLKTRPKNELDIFYLMRQACKDVGKLKLIEECGVDGSLRHFTKTAEGELNIHGKIIIHPKAYLQLPADYRRRLVEVCEKSEYQDIAKHTEVKTICRVYRVTFVGARALYRNRIHDAFKGLGPIEIIEQVEVGGRKIFVGIKPFEIDRLYDVFKQSCKEDNKLIAFGHRFADRIGCENITEYCAAAQYALRCLNNEVAARRENDKREHKPILSTKEYYGKVSRELLADQNQDFGKFVEKFRELQRNYNEFRPNNAACNLKFANSMAAANHYDKHKDDFPGRQLTLEDYFNLAVNMTSGQVADCRVECQWTQDGTSLRREFVSKTHDAFAIVIDRPDGTSVIATLQRLWDKQVGPLRTTRKPAVADIACTNVALFPHEQRSFYIYLLSV